MDYITLYNDDQCTDVYATAIVGDYQGDIYGRTPLINTYTAWRVVDEVRTLFAQLFDYYGSRISPSIEPDKIAITRRGSSTDTLYWYLSSRARIAYKSYYVGDNTYRFDILSGQMFLNHEWINCAQGSSGSSPMTSYSAVADDAFKVSFCNGLYACYDDNNYIINHDTNKKVKGWIGINVHYYDQQGHAATHMCAFALASDPADVFFKQEPTPSYKPTRNTASGGRGSGGYTGDGISPMATTQLNSVWSSLLSANGFGLTYYYLTGEQFNTLVSWLYTQGLFKDRDVYRDAVVSAVFVPIHPDNLLVGKPAVYCANRSVFGISGVSIVNQPISERTSVVYDFSEQGYDSYADITDTEIIVYLPFVGRINIDPRAVFRGKLRIRYNIDVRNGNILYEIVTTSKDQINGEQVYGSYSGNCGIDIPLIGSGQSGTYMGKVRNLVSNVSTGIQRGTKVATSAFGETNDFNSNGSFAAGIAGGVIGGTVGLIKGGVESDTPIIDKSGSIDPSCSQQGGLDIRVDVWRTVVLTAGEDDGDYPKFAGIPSYGLKTVGDFEGLTSFSLVYTDKIAYASDSEKEEIRQLLNSGVII